MNPVDYLIIMQEKDISFRVIQHALKYHNLPSKRGWELAIEHYEGITSPDVANILESIYINQINYGQRTIYFNKLDISEQQNVESLMATFHDIETNISNEKVDLYRQVFPFLLNKEQLESARLNSPCPVCIMGQDNHVKLFMTYPRTYTERINMKIEDIDLTIPKMDDLSGCEEIIVLKNKRVQAYDCISFNLDTGIIQYQIDYTKNIVKEDIDKIITHYRKMIADTYKKVSGRSIPLMNINLHSKIDKLYNENDGQIYSLGHATSTGSVKTEKMRKRTDDLRTERFHQSGIEAINGNTNNFCITKQWNSITGGNLRLTIDGNAALASSTHPHIDYVKIEGCINEEDFNLLLSKVLE